MLLRVYVCVVASKGVGILLAYMINKIFEILFIVSLGKEEIIVKDFPCAFLTCLSFLQEKGDKIFCSLVYSRNYVTGDKPIMCICKTLPKFNPFVWFVLFFSFFTLLKLK